MSACHTLLVRGTKESARVNAFLVSVKVLALGGFVLLSLPLLKSANFHPFAPTGKTGMIGAASSIFFTFVGFDAVATAAEETREPQRNIPLGLLGALTAVTLIYVLVAIGATGAAGSQPLTGPHGEHLLPGSKQMQTACEMATASGKRNHSRARRKLWPTCCGKRGMSRLGMHWALRRFLRCPRSS